MSFATIGLLFIGAVIGAGIASCYSKVRVGRWPWDLSRW